MASLPHAPARPSPLNLREQPPTIHARTSAAVAVGTDDDSSAPNTPTVTEGARPAGGFILRIPASAGLGGGFATFSGHSTPPEGGDSPASPASASVGKRKRRHEPPGDTIAVTRPRRGRVSTAGTASPYVDGTGPTGTPGPSSSATTSRANSAVPQNNALSIFADPATTSDLTAEVQTIVGPQIAQREREREARERERRVVADESIARARPTRGGESHVRSGVSASGRGRRVGSRIQSGGNKPIPRAAKGKNKGEPDFVNQDFCSSCRGIGRFLCCDGCPRSFHFMCLDPPLGIDELPETDTWYCNKCASERNPAPAHDSPAKAKDKPITAVFHQLARRSESENPTQFRLPQEIRQFFVGVTAGPLGEYVDTEGARNKLDRKGFREERDPLRLRDAKSQPIQCYKCGASSIPTRSLASDVGAQWRPIVSCDYCNLHWHLDCLSPPLASMPSASRKWMCPNHSDQVMPRRRTVRNGMETVEVVTPGAHNNGNVVVVEDPPPEPLPTDDMVINNKRYRVPEKIIQLDFWNKLRLGRGAREAPAKTAAKERRAEKAIANASKEDLEAASLILGLRPPVPDPEPEESDDDEDGDQQAMDVDEEEANVKAEKLSKTPTVVVNGNGNGSSTRNGTPLRSTPPRSPKPEPKHRANGSRGSSRAASRASSPVPRAPNSTSGPRITLRINRPSP